MTDIKSRFQTTGMSWSERALSCEGVTAVYAPNDPIRSQWLAQIYSVCLNFCLKYAHQRSVALDFGCGIGHHTQELTRHFSFVIGSDITPEMLKRAKSISPTIPFIQIDGFRLPFKDQSVDFIWICAVLRYSLLISDPYHHLIVRELFRILKPGGYVCNLEMYVREPSHIFSHDFLISGFHLKSLTIANVQFSFTNKLATRRLHPLFSRRWWAFLSFHAHRLFVKERFLKPKRLRDYLFIYQKPIK